MSTRRAVITGIGLVTPAGRSSGEYFEGVLEANCFLKEIDAFDSSRYPARHAGVIEEFEPDARFSKRLMKKLDRFSQLALQASDDAVTDAGLDIEAEDRSRVGIVLGNALGGWGFAEVELRDLHTGGLRDVSPYQATAWFPAAPQGQVSIFYGITGFAKTIISDIASSHLAIGYAARAIRTGRADVALAGGAEAPVSPYALLCCNTSGELSTTGRYAPFDSGRDGYVIGEGAAVLVVEELGRAVRRGARIYAEVKGFGHSSDGVHPTEPDPSGDGLARAMGLALTGSGVTPEVVDYFMPAGLAGRLYDSSEANAARAVFGARLGGGLAIGIPKALYGNLLGASGAVDAACACMAMERGAAPAYTGCAAPDDGWGWAVSDRAVVEREIKNVLINSIGRGGVNASLLLAKM